MAEYLQVSPEEVSKSERFESAVLAFLKKLEPETLDFLDEKPDATGHANYQGDEKHIRFCFKQYKKEQIVKMAEVLERRFPGIKTEVQANDHGCQHYWLKCDRELFFNKILPCVFNAKPAPKACWFPSKPMLLNDHLIKRYIMYKPVKRTPKVANENTTAVSTEVSTLRPRQP